MWLVCLAGLSSCASPGPFDEPTGADPTRTRHRIVFEVMCQACTVRYSTPDDVGRAQVVRAWSENVGIWVTGMGAAVELSVIANAGSASVGLARIRVDGAVAEEYRGAGPFETGTGVTLRTIVRSRPRT